MKHRESTTLLLLLLFAAPAARGAGDPFYQSLLRDGQQAFDRKEYATATRDLRLACFGMLDEPRPLAECLSRLALAQDGAGDIEGFRETFRRLTDVEDRFKGYSQAEMAPELRAALEARLAARIPAATLAGAPAFHSALARKGAAALPVSLEKSPPKAGPASAPAAAPPAAHAPATVKPAPVPSPPVSSPVAVTAPKPLTDAERQKLDQARKLLGDRRTAKELRQAFELSRAVADAHPDSKEAQLLAAEGAYRISRWSDAATYFRRGGDPGDEEPERLFYMAVALYESGDAPAAAAALRRSLPNLKRTPYVDSYTHKILPQ
jgi:tetratricopeptide (TPR) repeat protein